MKKIIACMMAATMLFGLASCGGSGEQAKDGKKSITLGFSQVGSESEFRTANTNDIKEAAKKHGITLQFSDAQQKQDNQIKAIRTFIASEVDVISFVPIVGTGWETVLQEAKEAKIPVVLVDRTITAKDDSLYVTHIGTDAVEEGAKAFQWIDKFMKEQNKKPRNGSDVFSIAILEGTVGSSIAGDRLKGFKDAMASAEDAKKYKIIQSQTGEYTRAKGKEVMESFLKSDGKNIDILFSANDDMALGAIQAIKAAGLKPGKDIVIVSIDASKGAFNAIIEGDMNAAVEHNPLMGEKLMEVVEKIVKGEKVERNYVVSGGVFDATNAKQELPNRKY